MLYSLKFHRFYFPKKDLIVEDYIIENAVFSYRSSWSFVDNLCISILPPQRRSVLVSRNERKTKLVKIDFPELIFIYYQLISEKENNCPGYATKLRALEFYDKKENILDSIVAPIKAPNCYSSSSGNVCLGDEIYTSKINNLKDHIFNKFFNATFTYFHTYLSEKDVFQFKDNSFKKDALREFIPVEGIHSLTMKKI
jgi:hypothetical protein